MFTFISGVAGIVFVVSIIGFIYKRDAVHWKYLELAYGEPYQTPITERWGHAVLYGKFGLSKSYDGILKVGIHKEGFSLRVKFPLISFFCKPLFIPYKDIRGWSQTWYINAKTVELELVNAPEVKLVMPRTQVEWIRAESGAEISIMNQPSPHADKPVFWHAYLLISSVIIIGSIIYIWLTGSLS